MIALNRSNKRRSTIFTDFTPLYLFVYCYLIMLNCLNCPFLLLNSSDPKGRFSFDAFIMNNNVLLCLYSVTDTFGMLAKQGDVR